MRVAVVGAGVSGLIAARTLALAGVHVVLYEKEAHIGGHARTHRIESDNVAVDLGFMVFNRVPPSPSFSHHLSFLMICMLLFGLQVLCT